MAKPERGLPKSFDIKMPERPVTLGDYLDDEPARPPVRRMEDPPPPAPTPAAPAPVPMAAPEPAPPPPVPQRRKTPSRKQINMTPETLRMLDELLTEIRNRGAERDVRASEVLHSLVLAAYEARPYLDLSQMQPRGQWGSASAAALPLALRDALRRAMAESAARQIRRP